LAGLNPGWYYPARFKTSTYSAYAGDVVNITDYVMYPLHLRVERLDNKGNYNEVNGKLKADLRKSFSIPV